MTVGIRTLVEADGGHREESTTNDVLDEGIQAKVEDEEEETCVAEANVILLIEMKKNRMVVKQQCRDRIMVHACSRRQTI